MDKKPICEVSGETKKEEKLNYITHLIGLFLSFIGAITLLYLAFFKDTYAFLSSIVYIVTLVTLYAASSSYHACLSIDRKKKLRILDHSCIYLFIAGSYTPFTLVPLRPFNGFEIFYLIWALAFVGVIFKIFAVDRFKKISLASYLLMGWLVIFNLPSLIEALSFNAFIWFICGGISYTVGTFFFANEKIPFNHAIWHLFVIAGSLCHYFAILDFMQEV